MADSPQPHVFVVLGATGDLMARKLLPALYHLYGRGELPPGTIILGAARRAMTEAAFQDLCTTSLVDASAGEKGALAAWCAQVVRYQSMGASDAAAYGRLAARIADLEKAQALPGNRLFYLALPLEAFAPALDGLGGAGLAKAPGWTRVVIEKPFGTDLASAQALNATAHRSFDESQIYRIDHYLGKETVQNLLVLRFANMFVESLWNRANVEHVELTVAEALGVEGRAGYYEGSGAMRDMVQNHLTQVLTLIAMEPPATFSPDAIRNEKVKVLRSVEPIADDAVVFGQYAPGSVSGATVPGYRQEPGVPAGSTTETFVALRLSITNWRWQGVPFFLRTGKRMPAKSTKVVVTFRAPPVAFFKLPFEYEMNPDRLTILLQPNEGFEITFEIKVPGRELALQTHRMRFQYADAFGPLSDGYETLVADVVRGDPTLFVRADEVEESWRLYDPLIVARPPVHPYPAGSMGPPEADRIPQEVGYRWAQESPSSGS